ncbi:MAG: glycine--tRNA ligase [Thaumarchaeota archaeon]|nr:glycine--tRNA ligase [Candidatus Calditenuaceae archaeon]MDW8042649.1 glycine--tRNA ligase [Nitrososphaerota archaeon]
MSDRVYDELIDLSLRRGFFFPSCEIYDDAPAGFWDYGPLGLGLRNRFVEAWRRYVVRYDGMVELDGSVIMAKRVFVASGHLASFADPVTKCRSCGAIYRADRLVQEATGKIVPERLRDEEIYALILEHGIRCQRCGGELSGVERFNMMFGVSVGGEGEEAYLRPETCQSLFVDFIRTYKTGWSRLPLPLCQFGKSFRNEIAPRQSLLRLREFYQAEVEVFFDPEDEVDPVRWRRLKDYVLRFGDEHGNFTEVTAEDALRRGIVSHWLPAYYLALIQRFYEVLGVERSRIRLRRLGEDEKAFYAREAWDLEVLTSLGWIELVACNYRGDYDLSGHMKVSGKDLTVLNRNRKVLPHVFELSMGVDRSVYVLMELGYAKEPKRRVLRVPKFLAPVQVAVLPLVERDGLPERAWEIYEGLRVDFDAVYEPKDAIGKRYHMLDEIGVPYCVTVDYQTLEDDTVTVRDRDTTQQVRVRVSELKEWLSRALAYPRVD